MKQTHAQAEQAPWYKQKIFWILMSGPIIVVIAGLVTFAIAQRYADEMVSDDYYKDGKHINLKIGRDIAAAERNIHAQVLISPAADAAKILLGGNFDPKSPLNLVFLHPAKSEFDRSIVLEQGAASGDKTEYTAQFQALPHAVHWYVRLEDAAGTWRVETKWLPSQGAALELKPVQTLVPQAASAAE